MKAHVRQALEFVGLSIVAVFVIVATLAGACAGGLFWTAKMLTHLCNRRAAS